MMQHDIPAVATSILRSTGPISSSPTSKNVVPVTRAGLLIGIGLLIGVCI